MTEKHFTKLELIAAWNKRPLVDRFIDNGLSGFYIYKWMNENGFSISAPTVYRYIEMRTKAIKQGTSVTNIIANRRKKRIGNKKPKIVKEIESGKDPSKNRQRFNNPTNEDRIRDNYRIDHVKSESEIIDFMLDKGYKQLQESEGLNPQVTKQIIELLNLKQKFSRSGITEYGKQQLRLEKEAMENVVASILFDYVPEDKQQGVIDRINEETSEAIRKIKDAQK